MNSEVSDRLHILMPYNAIIAILYFSVAALGSTTFAHLHFS